MEKFLLKRSHKIFLAIFFVSVIGLRLWAYHWPEATLVLNDEELKVLVAKSPNHQFRGLGGRDSLYPYDGMLFVFSFSERVGIVMRDMRFPIDIVWIDNGVVVDIAQNVPLEPGALERELRVYRPRVKAEHVLELSSGWAEAHGLKIGDKVFLEG